jgi:hypothetical protein
MLTRNLSWGTVRNSGNRRWRWEDSSSRTILEKKGSDTISKNNMGMKIHTYNPSYTGGRGRSVEV